MTRHERIERRLNALNAAGIVRSWYRQSLMPDGVRWNVEPRVGSSRSYTTSEAEAWLEGVRAATDAP